MDLRAAPLQDHVLPEALAALAFGERGQNATRQQQSGVEEVPRVQYGYTPTHNFPALPARIEAGLYRIAQEALANARKHAQAQHIEMTLIADEHHVRLEVQDDGCGFDPDTVTQVSGAGHFGLAGMAERAKLLGGSICIQSTPGAGTCIDVCVPYR
jgi:two-component system NarL family sensor kinase